MFLSDHPRGPVNCLWLWGLSAADPLPVALALTVPLLFAGGRLPVALLRFPPRPHPRRLSTALAAIALARLPRMKTLLASFQQTTPGPGGTPRPTSCPSTPPSLLIYGIACMILGKAHGR